MPYTISTGHKVASEIAAQILERGGNAVDAGIAACVALSVLHADSVQFGGVSPILVRMSGHPAAKVIDGVGRWPAITQPEIFQKNHRGRIPVGIKRCVVPGAISAWITALRRFGTMRFGELATPALHLARDGFPAHQEFVDGLASQKRQLQKFPENARIWLPNGEIPEVGSKVTYPALARTISRLIAADDPEMDRESALCAVHDLFYRGEIAREISHFFAENGGWLSIHDLAQHRTTVGDATAARVFGGTLFTCGPWSQGPALSQTLQILEQSPLARESVSEASFLHCVIEALKLALADREAFYGDPDFVEIPMNQLLSPEYAEHRAGLIRESESFASLPPPGLSASPEAVNTIDDGEVSLDTSVAVVKDSKGNVFAATPSDMVSDGPVVPNLGFVVSTRGSQSFVQPNHPAAAAPGRRPRVTACPSLFAADDGRIVAGGGPGGDYQLQAMAQVLARHLLRGEPLANALAAPRVFTQSAPQSSSPHLAFPGRVSIEEEMPEAVCDEISKRGHRVVRAPAKGAGKASLCLIAGDAMGDEAPTDPRRASAQILQQIQNRSHE